MAVVPVSGSNVFFLKGVPFSNDYKDIRWFDNISNQYNYFNTRDKVHVMREVTYVENDGKNFIRADVGIDQLRSVNYMMFQNEQYHTKWFYAFVTNLVRKNDETTFVYFEIDIIQTWMFEIGWKPSYIVREHCKLWNEDGTPVINTIDEGLNYGLEYETVKAIHHIPNNGIRFLVIATKKAVHGTNKDKVLPSVVGVGQPFSYYVVPFTDKDVVIKATIQGEEHRMSTLIDTLASLYKDDKMTNNIVTMFITEQIGLRYTTGEGTINFSSDNQVVEYAESEGAKMVYVSDVKTFVPKSNVVGNKYADYRPVRESKLLMYPYTVLSIDDMQGNRQDYKNEYISTTEINLVGKGSLGTSNKLTYTVDGYNININDESNRWVNNEFAIHNINPNDVTVMTDMTSAFMQANKNSLINQKDKIIFNGYANMAQSTANGLGSIPKLDIGGATSSAISTAKAGGNMVLDLQGINAKLSDIANVPPSINKMGTNTSYDVGNGYIGVFLLKKQIKPEYQRKLEDFFNMFGYKVNEVKIPNLHTRQNWNYVQTKGCTIVGDFNTEDLNQIKAIFDRGTTLWHTNDVGNYDLENGVI